MADKKISQLTEANPLTGTEVAPIVQSGSTVKVTVQDIANKYQVAANQSSAISNGWLSSADWSTFNSKAPSNASITFGSTAQALGSTVSSINGVSIGNSSASTGTFTSLTSTQGTVLGSSNAAHSIVGYTTNNWNYSHVNLYRNASNTATPRLLSFMLDADSVSSTTIGGYPAIWGVYSSAPTTGSTSSALNAKMGLASYAGFNYYINGVQTTTMHASGGVSVGDTTDPGAGNLRLGTGNLVIGTSGKGIDFSATAGTGTSELLADYEEGTWTPAMTFSTSQGDLSYGIQTGLYTKIGRAVVLQCALRVTETTASGNITITGLPYASANVSGNESAGGCYVDNYSGVSGGVVARLPANSSTIYVYYTATGSATQLSNTNTGTNSSLFFTISYTAT